MGGCCIFFQESERPSTSQTNLCQWYFSKHALDFPMVASRHWHVVQEIEGSIRSGVANIGFCGYIQGRHVVDGGKM